jgi:site-specific recombinase XerD
LSRRINALRSFFRYLEEMDHIGTQPTARLRQPRKTHRLPVCLTDDEAERLLNAAYEQHFTLVGFRDYAVIATLLFTGLRRSELLALRLEDVDLERGWIHVRKGKGRRQRRIPICAKLESAISDWLEFRPDVSHDSLFTDRQGRRFGKDGLYLSLKRCLKTARISKAGVSIHTLRHTFASSLIRAGVGVTEVQRLLGHADLATTGLYITIADDQLIDAVREHPLNVGAGWDDDG